MPTKMAVRIVTITSVTMNADNHQNSASTNVTYRNINTSVAWQCMVRASDLWATGCNYASLPCTAGLVLGWWAGKPSRYVKPVTSVNSTFRPSGVGKSSTVLWLGLRRSVFTCVRRQVTLCHPIY